MPFLPTTLKKLGLQHVSPQVVIDGEAYVSLASLAPEVNFTLDAKESTLLITADPGLFRKHRVDLGRQRPRQVNVKENSAVLNYSLHSSMQDDLALTVFSVPWEIAIKLGDLLGFSSFSYTRTKSDESFVRLLTNISVDNAGTFQRYILGDVVATSGDGGGSGLFGGFSVSKNYAMWPGFIKFPGLELSSVLQTPSEVAIYVNDRLVREETLPPGELALFNFPSTTGGGHTTLVIRDAYGREEHIVSPFYLSSRLLKPGLHEYSYNLGFRRQNRDSGSVQYRDLAFAGFHRIGLSRSVTGGLRAEIDKDILNLGATANFLLGTGEMNTSLAFSHNNGRLGFRALARYLYARSAVNFSVLLEKTSREYASIFTNQSDVILRGTIRVGLNLKQFGRLSAEYSRLERYAGSAGQQVSFLYRKRLLRNLSLFVSASRTEGEFVRNQVFVGLNALLGKNKLSSLNTRVEEGQTTVSTILQQKPPLGTGIGYRFEVDTVGNTGVGGQARLLYRSPYGIYAFDHRRSTTGQNRYDLTVSGSMALINRYLYLSRPISDSFALVKVGDLRGVKILHNNQEVGVTNRRGEFLVPGLISHFGNRLSIEPSGLPIEYNILETAKYVSTPFRSGGLAEFGVAKLRSFEGRFFFLESSEGVPAEYAGVEITVDDKTTVSVVGKRGAFYLENLPSGTFPARLFTADKECHLELTIPASDEMILDLGEIVCEMR